MPLSEEELKLLEQMERALVEDDPKLAHTLRGTSLRRSARRRAIVSGFVFAVGIAVLMTGAIAKLPVVGIAGFVLMLGGATVGLGAVRSRSAAASDPRAGGAAHPSGFTVVEGGRAGRGRGRGRLGNSRAGSSRPFMERVEERWRRRREGGGF